MEGGKPQSPGQPLAALTCEIQSDNRFSKIAPRCSQRWLWLWGLHKKQKTSPPRTEQKPSEESVLWVPQAQKEVDFGQDMLQNSKIDQEGASIEFPELEWPWREKNGPRKEAASIKNSSTASTMWQREANVAYP